MGTCMKKVSLRGFMALLSPSSDGRGCVSSSSSSSFYYRHRHLELVWSSTIKKKGVRSRWRGQITRGQDGASPVHVLLLLPLPCPAA